MVGSLGAAFAITMVTSPFAAVFEFGTPLSLSAVYFWEWLQEAPARQAEASGAKPLLAKPSVPNGR